MEINFLEIAQKELDKSLQIIHPTIAATAVLKYTRKMREFKFEEKYFPKMQVMLTLAKNMRFEMIYGVA